MVFTRRGRDVCPILKLHGDQLGLIVSRLPLQDMFQLRCVCKAWKIFFSDDWIFKCFIRWSSQTPVLGASLYNGLAAYNAETRDWNRWTPALHARFFSRFSRVYGNLGDLLLVEDGLGEDSFLRNLCLTLVNPTKPSSKKLSNLPQVPMWRLCVLQLDSCTSGLAVGLIPGEGSESWKAYVVNFENPKHDDFVKSYKVNLYDAKLDSWKAIWPWELQGQNTVRSITFYEGALHCILQKAVEGRTCYWNTEVCRYGEQKSCWQELSAQVSGKFYFQHLFEWQGWLMLIGGRDDAHQNETSSAGVRKFQGSRLVSVHIWELDRENHVWRERTRMPDHFVDHLCPPEFDLMPEGVRRVGSMTLLEGRLFCEIRGPFICLTNFLNAVSNKFANGTVKHNYNRHVICDLSKKSWWEVSKPTFPYLSLGFCHLTPKEELDTNSKNDSETDIETEIDKSPAQQLEEERAISLRTAKRNRRLGIDASNIVTGARKPRTVPHGS